LPAVLREVLILNSFEDLGYEEIARVLDIPVGTVSSRIYTARRKLAARLPNLGT
jgi:RNA polymerase sigma-70 factor (ECF subfamily)